MNKRNRALQIKSFDAEFKALEDKGEFEGYGSIFGNQDSVGDVVMPGAFKDSLNKRRPALLWQHSWNAPIGIYTEVREDERGLYVKGQLNMETTQGRECYSLLKQGALSGLSIGYRVLADEMQGQQRLLRKLDLLEVSVVTFPANELATVASVKGVMSERELERFLRDVGGFSVKAAKAIVAKGYSGFEEVLENSTTDDLDAKLEPILNQLKEVNDDYRKQIGSGADSEATV